MKENSFFKPVIVLSGICFFVTLALALTNFVSAPVIAANTEKAAIENRIALLPDADNFTDATDSIDLASETGKATVTEVYTADNGAGAVFTVDTSSFGGNMTMMIGVDADGAITGVKVTDHADTPGVGTRNFTDEYLALYEGVSELTTSNVKKDTAITSTGAPFSGSFLTGASVTGTAMHTAVYEALAKFAQLG
ncbi:MAG: FMN-binding protein [Lachnospiraceae bacterium]|nr:FMN-binding protein [Lachnospiraceae bacterium]